MTDMIFQRVTAQSITRLLLLSYFVAIAIGLNKGSELLGFLTPVWDSPEAIKIMRGIVLLLALMILAGIGRRVGALTLSLIVFFSSYTALYSGADISLFWRDLALIGGLLMTADLAGRPEDDAKAPKDRAPDEPDTDENGLIPLATGDEGLFREDFDIARPG